MPRYDPIGLFHRPPFERYVGNVYEKRYERYRKSCRLMFERRSGLRNGKLRLFVSVLLERQRVREHVYSHERERELLGDSPERLKRLLVHGRKGEGERIREIRNPTRWRHLRVWRNLSG